MNKKQLKILLKILPRVLLLLSIIGGFFAYIYLSFVLPRQNRDILNDTKVQEILQDYNNEDEIISLGGIKTRMPMGWGSFYSVIKEENAERCIIWNKHSNHYEGIVLTVYTEFIDNEFIADLKQKFYQNKSLVDLTFFSLDDSKFNSIDAKVLQYTYYESGKDKMLGKIFFFNHYGKHFTIDIKGENLNTREFKFIIDSFTF